MTNLFALCALFLAGCGAAAAGTAAPSKSIFDELWKNSTAQNLIKAGDLSLFELLLRSHLEKNFDGTVKELAESGLGQFPNVRPKQIRLSLAAEDSLPVVQMHGMGDFAKDPFGMVPLAKDISDYLGGVYVLNVQIGDNSIEDIMNGFLMNLDDQVDYFAKVVQNDANLANGFNAVGYSQGNLVIRGYIERYNSPPVFNFISMHGPLAGVAAFPGCSMDKSACRAFSELLGAMAYHPKVQQHLAQANYFRDPFKISEYQTGAIFLPDINNEDGTVTTQYAERFASLQSLTLVKALGDTVVVPNESEWFGFFADNSFDTILSFDQTEWYKADSFGLQSLQSLGNLFLDTTEGNHLDFETDFLLDLIGEHFVV